MIHIDVEKNKETIITLLQQVGGIDKDGDGTIGRQGVEELIDYLENESDFFTAPCSTEFHLAVPGGLAQHSLNVFNLLFGKCQMYAGDENLNFSFSFESVVVCGLMHDLCKANFYGTDKKWRKDSFGKWEQYDALVVKDQLPMGHGEKSVYMLSKFIPLTDEEALAIRWHLLAFDPGIHFNYPSGYPFREATKRYPLVTLLFTADYEASNIVEVER